MVTLGASGLVIRLRLAPGWRSRAARDHTNPRLEIVQMDRRPGMRPVGAGRGRAVIQDANGEVFPVDLTRGGIPWKRPSKVVHRACVTESSVIVGTPMAIEFLDLATGEVQESVPLEGEVRRFAESGERLYVLHDPGRLSVFSLKDRTKLYEIDDVASFGFIGAKRIQDVMLGSSGALRVTDPPTGATLHEYVVAAPNPDDRAGRLQILSDCIAFVSRGKEPGSYSLNCYPTPRDIVVE